MPYIRCEHVPSVANGRPMWPTYLVVSLILLAAQSRRGGGL
jgi:hypothetical protein